MPEFLFIFHDHGVTHEGLHQEFPDLQTAKREAVRTLTELASEDLPNDGDQQALSVVITNTKGEQLLTATLDFKVSKKPPV